jgi:hypothetical protein
MEILFSNNPKTIIPTANYNLLQLAHAMTTNDLIGLRKQNYIVQLGRPLYIALFHEMLHWYQHLRYYKRTRDEMKINIMTKEKTSNSMLNYYSLYGDNSIIVDPGSFWRNSSLFATEGSVRVDEMRVILGILEGTKGFLNGDDLSENLLRYFSSTAFNKILTENTMKFYIRFGSDYSTEDMPSIIQINKACKVVEKIAKDYNP